MSENLEGWHAQEMREPSNEVLLQLVKEGAAVARNLRSDQTPNALQGANYAANCVELYTGMLAARGVAIPQPEPEDETIVGGKQLFPLSSTPLPSSGWPRR